MAREIPIVSGGSLDAAGKGPPMISSDVSYFGTAR
jgi:hypothetical protein